MNENDVTTLTIVLQVLMPHVRWVTFHSGYDFGHLLKTLSGLPLPGEEREFFEQLRVYFPSLVDIKYLTRATYALSGGLDSLAYVV